MNCLLDTHTFLFCVFGSPKLGKNAKELILDPGNRISVSVVSFWEISLKYALRKLDLENVLPDDMPCICDDMGFTTLNLSPHDASSCHRLEMIRHKDPFDRMLIWQALQQSHVLISKDAGFSEYSRLGLKVVW